MKKQLAAIISIGLLLSLLTACTGEHSSSQLSKETVTQEAKSEEVISEKEAVEAENDATDLLEDGVYLVDFDTDSTMFHVNEACDGKAVLTVSDGKMTAHIVLTSQNILNLYLGLASETENNTDSWLQPVVEEVTYDDGLTEEVNAFDVPVLHLGEEFDLALIGTKGVWYDHKVSVSNPEPYDKNVVKKASDKMEVTDGTYQIEVTLTGGSGKTSVDSPTKITVENGECTATIVWSSPYYDYMIVDGTTYYPVNTEGNSVFEIPVNVFNTALTVIADTTAMSEPHEIEYTLYFALATIQ